MKDDSTHTVHGTIKSESAFYGVENAEKIPVRDIDTPSATDQEETLVQHLFNPTLKYQKVASWQSLILTLTVLLLGLAKAFSKSRFKQTYKSLFNYRVAQEVCGEEKVFFHRVNLLLTTNYILITALFIYQLKELINQNVFSYADGVFYVLIIVFLILLNFGKILFVKILAFIFNVPHLVSDYLFNLTLFNNLLGVFLIPVLALMYFTSLDFGLILQFFALPLLCISFILRLLRVVALGTEKGVSYLYIFLYICSLEILPLVVIIKIFIL